MRKRKRSCYQSISNTNEIKIVRKNRKVAILPSSGIFSRRVFPFRNLFRPQISKENELGNSRIFRVVSYSFSFLSFRFSSRINEREVCSLTPISKRSRQRGIALDKQLDSVDTFISLRSFIPCPSLSFARQIGNRRGRRNLRGGVSYIKASKDRARAYRKCYSALLCSLLAIRGNKRTGNC